MTKEQRINKLSNNLLSIRRELAEVLTDTEELELHGIAREIEQAYQSIVVADDWLTFDVMNPNALAI